MSDQLSLSQQVLRGNEMLVGKGEQELIDGTQTEAKDNESR